MTEPVLLYCVGATKSGTSWLYRILSDRDDCALSAVKEAHYWDTFSHKHRKEQQEVLARQRRQMVRQLMAAQEIDREWRIINLTRRIDDLDRLCAMLEQNRQGHTAYAAYMMAPVTESTRLIADVCPSYALLPEAKFREMAALGDKTRFVYIMRDPLQRLWSAMRMEAERRMRPEDHFEERANNMFWRLITKRHFRHLAQRSDYASAVRRLRAALPPEQLHVVYMEELMTQRGYDALCDFLELPRRNLPDQTVVNSGIEADLRKNLQKKALAALAPQYEFAEREIGPLPEAWLKSREGGL